MGRNGQLVQETQRPFLTIAISRYCPSRRLRTHCSPSPSQRRCWWGGEGAGGSARVHQRVDGALRAQDVGGVRAREPSPIDRRKPAAARGMIPKSGNRFPKKYAPLKEAGAYPASSGTGHALVLQHAAVRLPTDNAPASDQRATDALGLIAVFAGGALVFAGDALVGRSLANSSCRFLPTCVSGFGAGGGGF